MGAETQPADALQASVATTFGVLAWEMELAGARCLFLDSVIGAMMKNVPEGQRGALMEGLHTVDLLSQQLTSLSAFARRMSGMIADDVSASVGYALDDVTLGAMADRMCSALGGQERGVDERDGAGDLDLF